MTTVAFDTLTFARILHEKAIFSPKQAEALADAMAEALQGDLVTKADLAAGLADTKSEIIKWVAGLIGFQTIAIIGTVIALGRVVRP